MLNNPLVKWRGGARALAKKIFVGYLVLVTGCTSTVQQVSTSEAVEQNRSYGHDNGQPAQEQPIGKNAQGRNYNLPELGGGTKEPVTQERKRDAISELFGGMSAADQQAIADPRAKGYQGAGELQGMALGMLNSAATQYAKDWFTARHATAEISFNAGSKGGKSGSFDMLLPIYDTDRDLVFTQFGFRRSNAHTEGYRNTFNAGAGYRRNIDNWIAGVNAFYDRDMTGKNDRLGLGAEVFTDNVRFSGNLYHRLSDWKMSPDLEDYLERPANGYDLRVEGSLPSLPQVVGKAVYEQYFGDQVGLFSASDRQKDPRAVTLGVTYSPVPMIGLSVDHRQGQGGQSETTAKMTVNYQFGVPLDKQLSTAYSVNHKLANSRYGLVNRNNEIVLEYREKDAGQIMVPALIHGTGTQVLSFPVTFTDSKLSNFSWVGTAAGFAMPYGGGATATLTLPAYSDAGSNLYTLQAVGTDNFGRVVSSNVMQVRVDAFQIALERSKSSGMANGTDAVTFTATLLEPSGDPKSNTPVTWDVQGTATVQEKDERTNQKGQARLKLASRFANSIQVSVQEPQGAKAESNASFAGDINSARVVSLTATPSAVVADGSSSSKLVAQVQDANGNSLPAGVKVDWSASLGAVSEASSYTDENSQATVTISSKAMGESTIVAAAVKGSAKAKVTFSADNGTAKVIALSATPTSIIANGAATSTLEATVEDVNSNPVQNAAVAWSTDLGDLSSSTTVTDASGKARVTLKGTVTGSANVKAAAAAGSSTAAVQLTADASSAKVIDLTATPATIVANGVAVSELVATVEDASGHPVPNAPVTWATDLGSLSSKSSTTDANGKARVTLKGTAAGSASVKASASAGARSAVVQLTADASSAKVIELTATPATILANGVATSSLVATVEDTGGNPVPNAPVTWTADLGSLSSNSSTTDANGKARVTLKGATAGSANVKASASAGASSTTVKLIADASSAKVIDLTATPATILANGVATSSLVATVEDAGGNPVPNAPVTWATDLGSLSSNSSTTDANGKTQVTLKGATLGSATVKATASAGASTTTVKLIVDASTAMVIDLTASPAIIVANGVATSDLVATVEDASGHPVPNAPVTWATDLGSLSSTSSTTDANGKARVTLKGATAGSASVKASAVAGARSAAVQLIADASSAKVIDLTATPTTIVANGVAVSELVATVEDASGNPVPNAPVTWATDLGSLSSNSSTTDAGGKARMTLKGATAGSASVKASASAGASSTTVKLIADASSAKVIDLTATPATIVANGVASSNLVATVVDAGGNPVPNAPVTWATDLGSLSAASSTTDASGKAQVTLKGTTVGSANVKATAAAGASGTTVTLTPDASTANVVKLTAMPKAIAANGTAYSQLVAKVEDAKGNPVPGAAVAWTTNLGDLSVANSVADSGGYAVIKLSGTVAGSATVQAAAAAGSSSTSVTLNADPATARVVSLVPTPTTIVANGSASSQLVAIVKDATGNAVPGVTVTWTTGLGDLSAATSVTDASGKAVSSLSGKTIGVATVTAGATAGSAAANVTLSADFATARIVSLTATSPAIPTDSTTPSTIVATVKDAMGNSVANGFPVNFATTEGSLNGAMFTTDANGQARANLRATNVGSGSGTVTASVPVNSANVTVGFYADAASAKVASLVPSPASVPADGTTSTLTATVVDKNDNPLGAGITVNFGTDLNSLSGPSAVTNSSGIASVTIQGTTAGTANVTAKTTVSGNATAAVVFTAVNPIINSFSVGSNLRGRWYPNTFIYDSGPQITYNPIFSWTVDRADRYELVDGIGRIQYSGTANSFTYGQNQTWAGPSYKLRAYNGTAVTEMTVYPVFSDVNCGSCGSGS